MTEQRTRPTRIRVSGLQETQLHALVEVEEAAAALYVESGFAEGEVPARRLTDIVALTRDHNVRVAEADHVVAGYAAWRDEAPGVGVIGTIAVHPDFQRVGVGSKLVATIEEEARDAGLKHLVIRCRTKAPWAMEFCRRLGFSAIGADAPGKVAKWGEDRAATGLREDEAVLWAPVREAPEPPADEDELSDAAES
jgi:amino-acid N-acetyltransferase